MLKLTEEEKDSLLEEELDEVYMDWVDQKDYNFAYEIQCLDRNVDRYTLEIKDQNGNTVYYSEDVNDIISNDKTYDDAGDPIAGFEFKGVEDGIYLTRVSSIKGCYFTGEFEIQGKFDKSRLYIVQDDNIDDELTGEYLYPFMNIFYQQGETPDLEKDDLHWEYDSDMGEQYWDTYLFKVENEDEWENLKED